MPKPSAPPVTYAEQIAQKYKRGQSAVLREDDFNFQKKQEIRRKRTAQPNQRQKMIEKIRDVQTREQQRLISNIQNPSGDLTLSNERKMSNLITPDCN